VKHRPTHLAKVSVKRRFLSAKSAFFKVDAGLMKVDEG
jgi:hypothetical protein